MQNTGLCWLRAHCVPNGNRNIMFKKQKQLIDSFLGYCIYYEDKQKAALMWTQLFLRKHIRTYFHLQKFPWHQQYWLRYSSYT